jgi:hypothetical protein
MIVIVPRKQGLNSCVWGNEFDLPFQFGPKEVQFAVWVRFIIWIDIGNPIFLTLSQWENAIISSRQ